MRRKVSRLAATVIGTVGVVIGAAAQQSTTTETKNFTVISVDGSQLVVRLPEGTKEITVPEDFRFTVNGQPMSVHELKPGMSGTAVITTTTTVKPVTVTEVRNATVEQVSGSSIIVRGQEGYRVFTQGEVDKRNIKIVKDGQPVGLSDLHKGDQLTATIVTAQPPTVLTERQVQATLAKEPEKASTPPISAKQAAPSTASAAAVTATSAPAAAPAPAHTTLPKTASPLPLLGLIGIALVAIAVALRTARRRWIAE